MIRRDIVVMGASAGGVEILKTLVAGLPPNLPAAILLVLHIPPHVPSMLGEILDRVSALPVVYPKDGDPILPGHVYVPKPDHHLLVEENRIRVTRGPKENRARPAVDVLFRSAAYFFGPRVIGIVLTGNLDDGTAGLWAVKDRGGVALVQSPEDAAYPSMPQSALEHVAVDDVLPAADMPDAIVQLVGLPAMNIKRPPNTKSMETEIKVALGEDALHAGSLQLGTVTANTCPECHGVLSQMQEGPILRYRCHTGHAFSSQVLLNQIEEEIDTNLWNTLRVLDEQIILMRKMAQQEKSEGSQIEHSRYDERIHKVEKYRQQLRSMVISGSD